MFDLILQYWTDFKSLVIAKLLSVHKNKKMDYKRFIYRSCSNRKEHYIEIFRHSLLCLHKLYTLSWRLAKFNACVIYYFIMYYILFNVLSVHMYLLLMNVKSSWNHLSNCVYLNEIALAECMTSLCF